MNCPKNSPCRTAQKWSRCGSPTPLLGLVRASSLATPRHSFTRSTTDTFMSKTARLYRDTRAANASGSSNLDKLNDELQDVTRIMTKNMEELLWRGDSLDSRAFVCLCGVSSIDTCPLFFRNVAPFYVTPFRVGKVSQGSEECQHSGHDTTIRSIWCCGYIIYRSPLVALFMKSIKNCFVQPDILHIDRLIYTIFGARFDKENFHPIAYLCQASNTDIEVLGDLSLRYGVEHRSVPPGATLSETIHQINLCFWSCTARQLSVSRITRINSGSIPEPELKVCLPRRSRHSTLIGKILDVLLVDARAQIRLIHPAGQTHHVPWPDG